MKKEFAKQLIPALLIFLFTYAAVSKLSELDFFRAQLSIYPFIKRAASFLAIGVPAAELGIAGCLFVPATRMFGLYASALLLLCFTGYLFVMVLTQRSSLPCSCGGVISSLTWQQHILFNLFFIFLSLVGIRLESEKAGQPQSFWKRQPDVEIKRTAQKS